MSNYIISNGELYNADELMHYGVIGMKWGVRRGNYSTAYEKAVKKANKLEKKYAKANLKAAKKTVKAAKKMSKATSDRKYKKALKAQRKAAKATLKAAKLQKKGAKWTEKMEKAFKDVKVNDIDKDVLDKGRKYMYMLGNSNKRTMRDVANDTHTSLKKARELENRNTKNVEALRNLDKKIIEKQNSKPTDADRAKHEKLISEQRKIQMEVSDLANRNSWMYKNNTKDEIASDAYKQGMKDLEELIGINNRIMTNRYEEP